MLKAKIDECRLCLRMTCQECEGHRKLYVEYGIMGDDWVTCPECHGSGLHPAAAKELRKTARQHNMTLKQLREMIEQE